MKLHDTDYQLLNSLYKNTPVIDAVETAPVVLLNEIEQDKKYLLAVLCVAENEPALKDNEKAQLERILVYLKEQINTIPVFICSKTLPLTLAQLSASAKFEKLIVFGGSRKLQALNVEVGTGYTPVKMYDYTLFFVHSLALLENDGEKKKLLAQMLKQYFEVAK